MRKITSGLFMSLDGVVEDPQTWHFPYFSDEMGAAVGDQMQGADTMLMGRRTYESFASSWGHRGSEVPFADVINAMPKLVASNTLSDVPWRNCQQIRGDAIAHLAELKGGPGGDIAVPGSVRLIRSLLRAGLLDRLSLMIHPIVVGSGQRLFDDSCSNLRLELSRSASLPHGVSYLTYTPAAAE